MEIGQQLSQEREKICKDAQTSPSLQKEDQHHQVQLWNQDPQKHQGSNDARQNEWQHQITK